MRCLVTSNKIFSLTLQKGDSITGVGYSKMKKGCHPGKTIISEKSQIHAAPNFLLLSSRIASYVAINCYTLVHQATRGERNNSFRRCRNIFVSGAGIFSSLVVIFNDFSVLYKLCRAIFLQVI